MKFTLIDIENWSRKEFYRVFTDGGNCTYTLCVNIDITNIRGHKLYLTMLWLLTGAVNEMPEFRTALTEEGLGIYDRMNPAYTLFNKETKHFFGMWTEYSDSYADFMKAYEEDTAKYENTSVYAPKPDLPRNVISISMIPWFTFTSLTIDIAGKERHLLPIFAMGKFFEENGRTMLPLSIQAHHAVCDGYHVGRFLAILQEKINTFCE